MKVHFPLLLRILKSFIPTSHPRMRGSAISVFFAAAAATVINRFVRCRAKKSIKQTVQTSNACRRPLKIVVLNPLDGSYYNANIMSMLKEMFAAAGVLVELIEIDIYPSTAQFPEWNEFDGVIIPGSLASAYDNEAWIHRLFGAIRELNERAMPTLGICFGHQVQALSCWG